MPYLLASALSMLLFFGVYWLFLRRLSFPTANRGYLLLALGASLLVPLVEVPGWLTDWMTPEPVPTVVLESVPAAGWSEVPAVESIPSPDPEPAFDWAALLTGALVLGAMAAAGRLGWSLLRLVRLLRQPAVYHDGLRVVPTAGGNASFFHHVLLNENALTPAEREQVLAHEAEHARRYHSLDRLAVELLLIPFWWNPVLYAYRTALVEVHEWEVDTALIRTLDRRAYASLLLKLHTAPLPLANLLGRRPLRTRIERILQPQTSAAVKKMVFLLALPVGIGALLAFGKPYTPDFAAGTDSVVEMDSIRFYESDRWGPNPLVIIDGKRYSSAVLKRIDPEKMSGYGMFPAGNPTGLKRFGPEAKDGVLDITTKKKDGVYTFDNDRDYRISVENVRKERAIPKDRFFAKYTLTDRQTGQPIERIRIQNKNGGGMSTDRKPDQKVYYLLDKKPLTEEQVATLRPEIIARINTRGTGEIKHYAEEWRKQFEPGSILMWMSTTGEHLETDPPRPPRPPKPDPAPAPPVPDEPTPATLPVPAVPPVPPAPPAPVPTPQPDESPGVLEHVGRRGTVARMSLNLNNYSPAFLERAKQFFNEEGAELTISNERFDADHKLVSVDIRLRRLSTGQEAFIDVKEKNIKIGWLYIDLERGGYMGFGPGPVPAPLPPLDLPAPPLKLPSGAARGKLTPVAKPVPAPTPQPDERPGVLERTEYLSRIYLNVEHYSPAFLERAKQFFKEDGVELVISNEQLDAQNRLESVDITLRTAKGSVRTHIGKADPKKGWICMALDRKDNLGSAFSLPSPPDRSKPVYSMARPLNVTPIWALLQPRKGC